MAVTGAPELGARVLLAVAAGGVLGGAARLAVTVMGDRVAAPGWVSLLVVNLLGSFLMGLVVAREIGRAHV